ncbi:putative ankyrin repeat protein, partial [Pseudolycoriella hygida]
KNSENRNQLLKETDSEYGGNCLYWAVQNNNIEAVEYLLGFAEVEVNAVDNEGNTIFMAAMRPVVQNFVQIMDPYGRVKFYYPPENSKKMVRMLFEANNDFVNCCSRSNESALLVAMDGQCLDVIKLLVQLGCRVNHISSSGESVLHRAALNLRVDVIRYLQLDTDCDLLLCDGNGWLPCSVFIQKILLIGKIGEKLVDFGISFLLATLKQPAESLQRCSLKDLSRILNSLFDEIKSCKPRIIWAQQIQNVEKKMRSFVLILFVAAVMPIAMGLDIGKLIAAIGPLIEKVKCAAPCIAEEADSVKSCDIGPLKALCLRIDDIVKNSMKCLNECRVERNLRILLVKIVKDICHTAYN